MKRGERKQAISVILATLASSLFIYMTVLAVDPPPPDFPPGCPGGPNNMMASWKQNNPQTCFDAPVTGTRTCVPTDATYQKLLQAEQDRVNKLCGVTTGGGGTGGGSTITDRQKCADDAGGDAARIKFCICDPSLSSTAGPPKKLTPDICSGSSTDGGGGGGDTGGGGIGVTPGGNTKCNPSTEIGTSALLQPFSLFGERPNVFGDTFTATVIYPGARDPKGGYTGIRTIEVGPLLTLTVNKQIPILEAICNAVSSLSEDIKAIRIATESIDVTTKRILTEAIGIHKDTTDLRTKEYVLDPKVRADASSAIEAERSTFNNFLKEGRKNGVTEFNPANEVKTTNPPNTFTPDISVYETEARKNAALLFYGELKDYFTKTKSGQAKKYKDYVLKRFEEKVDAEFKTQSLNIDYLKNIDNYIDADEYLSSLYNASVDKAAKNAVAEYIAGNTIIGGKDCLPGYLVDTVTETTREGTRATKVCRKEYVKITTPAPTIKALMEKFATTKVTQAELADELDEFGPKGVADVNSTITNIIDDAKKQVIGSNSGTGSATPTFVLSTDPKIRACVDDFISKQPNLDSPKQRELWERYCIDTLGQTATPPPPNNQETDADKQAKISKCIENASKPFTDVGQTIPESNLKTFTAICTGNPEAYGPIAFSSNKNVQPTANQVSMKNLASIGGLISNTTNKTPSPSELSLVAKRETLDGLLTTTLILSTDSQNIKSCIATSPWSTFTSLDGHSVLYESLLFNIGDIISLPSKNKPQVFKITHPQIFRVSVQIDEPNIVMLNNQIPSKQNDILNKVISTDLGIVQTSAYTLNLNGVENEDTITFKVNDATISIPVINKNPIDLIRRIITEATSGNSETKKAFSEYNLSQNGNILIISNKIPKIVPNISNKTYSLSCNINNIQRSASLNIAFP